ncbi:MAG: 50S ribosomal protein L17 [Candidatus Neomarinimicrobiota bacterium]
MRHQKRVAKLGMVASHRKAMLSNMAGSLIQHGKIKTTDARAKELRRVVERLITFGKKGTIHHRRLAYKVLNDRTLVKQLFDHIAPQYATRNGGYTRIVKLGFRDNDAAAVSLIEFVDYKKPVEEKKPAKPSKKESAEKGKEVPTEAKGKTEAPTPAPKTEKKGE